MGIDHLCPWRPARQTVVLLVGELLTSRVKVKREDRRRGSRVVRYCYVYVPPVFTGFANQQLIERGVFSNETDL